MQARIVPASNGARWLGEGWRIFRAAPLGWVATVFAYLMLTNILALVPVVGVLAALVMVPPLSFGLMAGARAASHGGAVELGLLFTAFREEWRPQLALGAVYMACSLAVYGLMSFADDSGALRGLLAGKAKPEDMQEGGLLVPLALAALAYTPVMMAFWFAPALAGWHSTGAAKALFFSFAACAMNWRAFLAYGAMALLIMVAVPFLILSGVLLVSGGTVRLTAVGMIFPLVIVMLPTLFASFYASYRDIFGAQAPAPGAPPPLP